MLLSLVATAALIFVNRPLETDISPDGLATLALTGRPDSARAIVQNWKQSGTTGNAFFSLGLEFLFFVAAGTALSFACVWSSQQRSASPWPEIGISIAWLQWITALAGIAGAICTGFLLGGRFESPWLNLARLYTLDTFLFFGPGIVYAAGGIAIQYVPPGWRSVYGRP
jgi:formate-dependent nitrite reductase membrane component NrfD